MLGDLTGGMSVSYTHLDVYKRQGNAIVNEIKAKGGEAMFLVTNVLDEAILEQNLKDILAAYGRVAVSYTHLDVYKRQVSNSSL